MTKRAVEKILKKIRKFDPVLRYWVFRQYLEDVENVDFLKSEIEYEMKRRNENGRN